MPEHSTWLAQVQSSPLGSIEAKADTKCQPTPEDSTWLEQVQDLQRILCG
jgi:hypothetical protein